MRRLSRAEFMGRLDQSIAASREWVVSMTGPYATLSDRSTLMTNAALMHMIADCAVLSGDQYLRTLKDAHLRVSPKPNWWSRFVDPKGPVERMPQDLFLNLVDYQRWFLHAMSPTDYPLAANDLADMFSPDKYRVGHATHQLMALYLYRRQNGSNSQLDWLIRHISIRIASEASMDFRVTDLYLQRIAVLLAAGQEDLVRRRWVERTLDAERPDGGWSYAWYGWKPTPYEFQMPELSSHTHATAQGMWILWMLKYRYPRWIETNYR